MDEVTVSAPATVSNVVCGFDVLGFCLEEPSDRMRLRKTRQKAVKIVNRSDFDLPAEPEKNVAGAVLLRMLEATGADFGFELEIEKGIKPGSGIGSSAASAAGAALAANQFFDDRFTRLELIDFAFAGEQIASAARHADNLAPAVFGGFVLVRAVDPLDVVELDFPPLFAVVLHPQFEIKTAETRRRLPAEIPLGSAVRQWANVGALVAGLAQKDYGLIRRSLEDRIVEPTRRGLIPKFDAVKSESLRAGALGGGISGSGPSIFMFGETEEIAWRVAAAMHGVYENADLDFKIYVGEINRQGVRIV